MKPLHSRESRAFLPLVFLLLLLAPLVSRAAENQPDMAPVEQQSGDKVAATAEGLSESDMKKLDAKAQELESRRNQIAELEERISGGDEVSKPILQLRLARSWIRLLQEGNDFASAVYALQDAGAAQSDYWDQAIAELIVHPDIARFASRELKQRLQLPAADASLEQQASEYARIFELIGIQDNLFQALIDSLAISEQYQLDVSAADKLLRTGLVERAANNSVMLELAMSKVKARESAQAMLPDNTDIKAQLSLARGQVAGLSTSLQAAVSMMSKLDMQTAEYREQIIHSTGEISTETVNAEVFGKLVQDWWQRFVDTMAREGPALLLNLFLFFVIILAALKLANIVARVTEAGLDKSQVNLSHLLRNMVLSVVRKLVLALGLLIALSQIGISLGPVLAGLGVAGFVIGFAMQDTLSNFASGMMILLYRPFDTGDVVEAGGVAGTVSNMSLVSTTILTFDNQTLVVPNNKIWGDVIKNVTSQRMRRVDLMFGVSYEDDIAKTERVLAEIVESDLRVLKTPAPVIKLHQLADSSVNFIVRPWVKTEDYWNVYWDLTRAVKLRFDEEHISIPYPQRDVHLDGIQLSQAAAAAD